MSIGSSISGGGLLAGGGNINGAVGAVDNRALRSDGAGGVTIQASLVSIQDDGTAVVNGVLVYVGADLSNDEKVQLAASFLLASDVHIKFYNNIDISAGAADVGIARAAAGLLAITNGAVGGGGLELTEIAAPAAPAANKGRLFLQDNGAGKTQLVVLFPTGVAQVVATEP